jgi:hypothetical protein
MRSSVPVSTMRFLIDRACADDPSGADIDGLIAQIN